MKNPDDTDSLPLYFPRATLEHAAPILSPLDRVPLVHHTDNVSPNRNGALKPKRKIRHVIHRGGLVQDLLHYPYLEMLSVGDHFLVPAVSGATIAALRCHVSLVCRQMSEVLTVNGWGYNVVLQVKSDPTGVHVTRVS